MLLARREKRRTPTAQAKGATFSAAAVHALLAFVLSAFMAWALLWPSIMLKTADDLQLAGRGSAQAYERLLRHPWPQYIGWYHYGIWLLEEEKMGPARYAFDQAYYGLDAGPLHLSLGAILAMQGQPNRARDMLEGAVWRTPSSVGAWKWLVRLTRAEERGAIVERARPWLSEEELADLEQTARDAPSAPTKPEEDSFA
jgi:hypothetical protein